MDLFQDDVRGIQAIYGRKRLRSRGRERGGGGGGGGVPDGVDPGFNDVGVDFGGGVDERRRKAEPLCEGGGGIDAIVTLGNGTTFVFKVRVR